MTKLKLIMIMIFLFSRSYAQDLKAGQKYKIISPVFLIANYNDSNNKLLRKESAKAYLEKSLSATKSYTAFRTEVPAGTIMTILDRAPKPWYLYFQGNQYFIKLEPDLSQGLDIKMQVDRGMEGNLDGLNPAIFSRM